MKKLYLIIFTLITLCGELSAQHVPVLVGRVISKQMALERIKSLFAGQEVDYYVGETLANIEQHPGDMPPIGPLMLRSNSFLIDQTLCYVVLVDENPSQCWNKSCRCFVIDKVQYSSLDCDTIGYFESSDCQYQNIIPDTVSLSSRFGNYVSLKPNVAQTAPTETDAVAAHTHVVMLNASSCKMKNRETVWNDCSYLYQVLRRKYGIPKHNFNTGPDLNNDSVIAVCSRLLLMKFKV